MICVSLPSASVTLRLCLPAWSVTVTWLPEYEVVMTAPSEVVTVSGLPSASYPIVVQRPEGLTAAVQPGERYGLETCETRPIVSYRVSTLSHGLLASWFSKLSD